MTLKTAPSVSRTKSHYGANRVRPKNELTGFKIVVTPTDTKEFVSVHQLINVHYDFVDVYAYKSY